MSSLDLFIKTDAQRQMIKKLHTLKQNISKRGAIADQQNTFAHENYEDLLNIGYNKATLPTQYGGDGFGLYDLILFQETLASFDGATALSIGWHLGLVGEIYNGEKWPADKLQTFAQQIVHNRALTNRIASERITGSPTRGGRPSTIATFNNGVWHITGRKNYASLSYALTHYLISAWIEEKQCIGFFLVPQQTEGVTIEETWDMIAMRGTASHDLIFNNTIVTDDTLIELANEPRSNHINPWTLHIPAVYLGIAQAARDYALQFARTHQPNSLPSPICDLPHVQEKISQIELKLQTARHYLYSVIEKYENLETRALITNELAVAKYIVVNNANDIVDLAMRIVGAQSLQSNNPLNRYYRDVRAGLHNPPMDDMTMTKLAITALQNK